MPQCEFIISISIQKINYFYGKLKIADFVLVFLPVKGYSLIMADPELVRALDYILNRCDEASIEAVAAAVVRRKRELAMFGGMSAIPNPGRLAKEMSSQINLDGAMDGMRKSIREYAIRIIRQEAPELTDAQIDELTSSWIPDSRGSQNYGSQNQGSARRGKNAGSGNAIPRNLLASMIDQFVSFSQGVMEDEEDRALRNEMGPWPDKYWKSFPQVIRLLITDYLKGEMEEADFNTRIGLALDMH